MIIQLSASGALELTWIRVSLVNGITLAVIYLFSHQRLNGQH